MLVFKKNIYFLPLPRKSPLQAREYRDEEEPSPLAFNFIHQALENSQSLFQEFQERQAPETSRQLDILFPHASRWGSAESLQHLSDHLWRGLWDRQNWWIMNCYHQCFLYDCLLDGVEEYSYSADEERRRFLPELEGRELDFNRFLAEYFFNTVFLIAPERFDSLSSEDRKQLGRPPFSRHDPLPGFLPQEDPTLEKVIHSIPPAPEDLTLRSIGYSPYEA